MNFIYFVSNLAICFCLSFIIGIERQFHHRTIGLRTSILVSIGSFLYVSFSFLTNDADITRVASQVVCGIGFLGAGVIIKDGIKVRGLTTAATLWCNSAIGVLCAGGYVIEALTGAIIILFSNIVLRKINKRIDDQSSMTYEKYGSHITIVTKKNSYEKLCQDMNKILDKSYITVLKDNYEIKDDVTINYTLSIIKGKKNVFTSEVNEVIEKYNCLSFKISNSTDETSLEEEII